jgi:DNA-binding CsgD family transcriptional regulator
MELLERGKFLTQLENAFKNLSYGQGCVVLISGEAGIGKTSLVENFTEKIGDKANILWGACDALFTPRPLGPLYDIATCLKNNLLRLLTNQSPRATIFAKFLEELQRCKIPNIVIIEDVHWADESTLDFIKFLGRRVNKVKTIFVLTYRNDEIGSDHPLKLVLGDIPSNSLVRLKLPPLTEKTVDDLAASSGIKKLFEITGGNPFLITELLTNKDEGIPSSIRDSILTRMSRLSSEAHELAEFVSIIPTRVEKWLVDEAIQPNSKVLDECSSSSILKFEDGTISFKHELSRMAVEESLSEAKRIFLNEKILQLLLKQKNIDRYLARVIHHAEEANSIEVIIEYAPEAARQASALGAHILAAEHYLNALKFVDSLSLEKQIDLYEGMAYECYLTGQVEKGIEAGETVLKLLKQSPDDPLREGEIYRKLSRMLWYDCKTEQGKEYLDKAIDILENLPAGKQLAMAYSSKSQFYMLSEDTEPAILWGEKALKLARKIKDEEIEAHALNNIGIAKMFVDDYSGEKDLKRSLELSLKNNFYEHAARAYVNIASIFLQKRRLEEADQYFSAGTEYCNDKDLYTYSLCMAGHNANVKLYQGKWGEATETVGVVFKKDNVPSGNKIIPLFIVGIIRARRNDPGAVNLLEESLPLALKIGEMDKIAVVNSGRAEVHWLQNNLESVIDDVQLAYDKIKDGENAWEIGMLAFWLWKANRLTEIPPKIAEPYRLQIKGDWKSAAKLWEDLHCPYEQALALSDGDEQAMKRAIEIFDSLGASATSQHIKQKMRELGIKSIPKGTRKTTRENIAGLTNRQLDILSLLNRGLSNIEIGNQLYISPKTVDHHISAILSKLNIHSRHEAAVFARSNGITKI